MRSVMTRLRLQKPRFLFAALISFVCLWTMVMLHIHATRAALHHGVRPLSPRLPPVAQPISTQMRDIRAAAAAAWQAYAATGMAGDDVRPLQGGTDDSLRMRATLFDSMGTLYVMGLYQEYEQAVAEALRIGAPRTFLHPTSSFEYNIRVVGGVLSAAQLSGDRRLLALAEEAAHTLLSSSYLLWLSPLPMPRVRMQPLTVLNFPVWLAARTMDVVWCLFERAFIGPQASKVAKVGSYSLELRALSLATGNKRYACIADAIQSHILAGAQRVPWPLGPEFHDGGTGLPPQWDTLTGLPLYNGTLDPYPRVSLGTGSDSFWEYLLKSHLMMPDRAPHLYVDVYRQLAQQLAHESQHHEEMQFLFEQHGQLFLSHVAGLRVHEHLGCYVPALLMLGAHALPDRRGSRDSDTGKRLLDGCIWTYGALCCSCVCVLPSNSNSAQNRFQVRKHACVAHGAGGGVHAN